MPLGRLSYKEYLKLHENAWGLLFPSISEEPLPYAIVESLLTGTIPIASKAGGVMEIVDNTPAEKFLFTPGDVDEFISKIEMLISLSREEVLNIGTKLREYATNLFKRDEIEKKILNIFESLIE
jgi:glycosyltransferase involved in cell wall biosynthesis